MEYVTLQRICDHAIIVRYHESGGGWESPWCFSVVVAKDAEGKWWFNAASGEYTRIMAKRIRKALYAAGFTTIHRLSGWGARARTIAHQRPIPAGDDTVGVIY
jgi:hypothetical protein